jgi:ABC-type amino acid transport substrate-binding protein
MRSWTAMVLAVTAVVTIVMARGSAEGADTKIKEIKERGVLRICLAESRPAQYKNPSSGKWEGYNVDAGTNLAETMGVRLEIVDATWGTLIPSLQANKCDIVLVDMFRTAERAMSILFSDPWNFNLMEVVVRNDSGLHTYEDVNKKGIVVVVASGTADEAAAKRYFPKATIRSLVTDNVTAAFLEVAGKRADAHINDTQNVKEFLTKNPQLKMRTLGAEPINPQGISYGIPSGEYHFQQFINVWHERTETSGLKAKWWEKWYGELPPKLSK